MRWDLIDKFMTIQKGVRATAVKSFSGSEDLFAEHFPGKPQVPATLMIEMVAQTGGVLFGLGLMFASEVILAKIDSARFDETVSPPCTLVIDAEIDGEREEGAWISGRVSREGAARPLANVRLLLATVPSLVPQGAASGKIVFNDTFLEHYDVMNVARASQARR